MYNAVAENVLGTIGTILWCIQLVPQIIRNFKVKNCQGLPPLMMFLWAASGIPFSIYFIGIDGSIPLRIQPQLFTFFCLVTWIQVLYYPPVQLPRRKLVLVAGAFVLVSVGLELGFILWLRPLHRRGITWPMLIIGIIASILLAVGLIPPYFELAKRKGRVIGINFVFLTMDSLGAIFSLLSIVVGKFDVLSCILYAIVIALELGIFTSHFIWWLRFGKDAPKESELREEEVAEAEAEAEAEEEAKERSSLEDNKRTSDNEIEVKTFASGQNSTFKPLNVLEDNTSKKDLEEEHTRELQFEQAFKLFQQALKLQKQQDYIEAYKVYEQLFRIDTISNHYYEEVDYIRGIQNGVVNSVFDELSSLSPNLKSLRYLIFRNRGFLFMGILKQESLISRIEDESTDSEERFKKMFYSMLDDFCVALLYNEADEKLLEVLNELWMYLKELKLGRATLEYAVSSKTESDDLSGLLPIDSGIQHCLSVLKSKLSAKGSAELASDSLNTRFRFLETMKRDIEDQQARQQRKNKIQVQLTVKDHSLSWEDLIDVVNSTVKGRQDESKIEDIHRPKLRFIEPYVLTEEPLDSISFAKVDVAAEKVESLKLVTGVEENENQGTFESTSVETSNKTEAEEKNDEQKQLEAQEQRQQIHRASKRLAKVESDPDKPAIAVEKEHFTGLDYFIAKLKEITPSLDVTDISSVYLERINATQYLKDFVTVINDWKPNFTTAFSSFNLGKSQMADDNVKLLEILNNFSGNIQKSSSLEIAPEISNIENNVLQDLASREVDYITLKTWVIKNLLNVDESSLILENKWSQSLLTKFNEWVLQFEGYLIDGLGKSLQDSGIAMAILELLVDQSISLESQIRQTVNSKKFNKAVTNGLCLELIKYNDKINKWMSIVNTMLFSNQGSEKDRNVLKARYKWCRILIQKSQTVAWDENKTTQALLEELLEFLTSVDRPISVQYPNYRNFPDLNLNNVRTQLTVISVLAIFWRILFSNQTKGNEEAVSLLEDILLDSGREKSEAIVSIKSFLETGSVDMRLSLWNILLQFYKSSELTSKLAYGFIKSIEVFNSYLLSDEYTKLAEDSRFTTLCKVLGFYNNNLSCIVHLMEASDWQLGEWMGLKPVVSLLEMCLLFEAHEEACSITSLRTSIKENSLQSYNSFKDMLLKTIVVVLAALKNDYSQTSLHAAIKLFHAQLGASGICDAANGIFLRASQEYISKLNGADEDMSQLIKCRYHYNIGLDGFVPFDHGTSAKEELVESDCEELAKFVLPLCFHTNTIKNVPKHDMKVIIEEMFEVIGEPNFESDEALSRNKAVLDYFLDTTRLAPKFVRDTFHGLMSLDLEVTDSRFGSSGLYYLQGLLIFSSYKLRKKNMQGRAVEIENAITLFRNDLICGGNRMESWFLMGQAYGYLVEDDLIWTSDKLTVPDRKIGTANLQRKSLICYLMAINLTLDPSARERIKPIVGNLMSLFAKELFGAVSEPMDMLALKVQSQPRFVKKSTGTSFLNVSEKSVLPKQFCLKLIKQSFNLAIKAEDADWSDFYYLSKTQRKLKDSPVHVLDTVASACAMASRAKQSDNIVEPYYSLVSLSMKYVKFGDITPSQGLEYLRKAAIIHLEATEVNSKREFYDAIVSSLKQIDAADKKNWQHRAQYRLARILYDEYNDVEGAYEIMSSFISLKSVNKQLVSIWKPESERPGKHFLYTYQYIRFFIDLLRTRNDIDSLITMIPKLRRSSSIMVNLYNAWEVLCATICRMMRDSLNIGDSFLYTDHFINNLSYSIFTTNVKSMFEFLQHKGVPAELVPHLCFLHGANDMKKSNNGYGPTSMIDDTIVTIFFKVYTYYNKDTNFFSTFNSPGLKKKIAKKDIFPLTNEMLKLCRGVIDSNLKDSNDGYNDALKKLLAQREEKRKQEVIELDTTEESEEVPSRNGPDTVVDAKAVSSEENVSQQAIKTSAVEAHVKNETSTTSSSSDGNVKRFLVGMGLLNSDGSRVEAKYNNTSSEITEGSKPKAATRENGSIKRPHESPLTTSEKEVIVIDSENDDAKVEERPAKRSK
ncbi:HIR3 [Candida margitis]|uniref:HIR3 n=1 Tax=Candida margitis TaxID=1775924 RepID=UPI0022265FE8|nr:HIR3 [Candida margitis]KAI5969070.1 HIR3 [Candida margitis]